MQSDYEYGLSRFMNEGRILARFRDHPCIVSVLDLVEENHTGYLIMGYLDGTTLKEHTARAGGKLQYEVARQIMMRVMDGLREVHSKGLLHRDISPDNIYLTRQGQVKILDFGAARFETGERSQSLSVVLKEGFAPEEQYRRNGNQGPWTDVYATAATFYRTITGVTPPSALDRLHSDSLQAPSQLGVAVPPQGQAAISRAIAVRAGDRFQSIEAFQEALASQFNPPPPPPIRAPEPPPIPVPPPPPIPAELTARSNSNWVWISIGLAVLFLVLVIGAVAVYQAVQEEARIQAQHQKEEQERRQEAERIRLENQAVQEGEAGSDRFGTWVEQRRTEMDPDVLTLTLINRCSSAFQVAIRFKVPDNTDHWVTSGWWTVKPGQSVRPKGMATANGNVYFYAFSENDQVWDGSSDSDSVKVPIVSNNFAHIDGDDIKGKNQRVITMAHKTYETYGNHEVPFTCTANE
jgi:uncharacterized membrane protein